MSHRIITTFKFALLAGASLIATNAWAQDGGAEGTEVEAITVVGSNIKGAKVTGVLPVTVMGPTTSTPRALRAGTICSAPSPRRAM